MRLLQRMMPAGLCALCWCAALGQGSYAPHRVLVRFRQGANALQQKHALDSVGGTVGREIPHIGVKVVQLPSPVNERAAVRALSHRPEVDYAELDGMPKAALIPDDTYWSSEWNMPKVGAPAAWDVSTGSSSIVVAILDTGCDASHPDLAPKYVAGWNSYNNSTNTADVYGHGTAVAGVAAAVGNNGTGVAGLAWQCPIMPVKISDDNANTTYSAIASGLTWAADHGARVANISWVVADSSAVSSAAQYFQNKGGVVAVSAGNSSTFDSASDNPFILNVSATDQNDLLSSFSNTGNNVDLSAPGNSLPTTIVGGYYGTLTGTSASAPMVAGAAALVLSVNPSLSGAQARSILEQNADLVNGSTGWNTQYGFGRLDVAKAVNAAASTPPPSGPTVSFSTPGGGSTVSGSVATNVSVTDNVSISSVTLLVDGVSYATSSVAPYNFTVNSSALANGSHAFSARALDSSGLTGSSTVTVTVNNGTDTIPPTCTILSPTGGTFGNTLAVMASASDNVGVTKVSLYVNGKLNSTVMATPYSFSMNTRKWAHGTYSLQCKAYDAAGNVGASQTVTMTH